MTVSFRWSTYSQFIIVPTTPYWFGPSVELLSILVWKHEDHVGGILLNPRAWAWVEAVRWRGKDTHT